MSRDKDGEPSADAEIPRHLDEAQHDLLLAQLHLAVIEGRVGFEELMSVRRLIAVAIDQVRTMHRHQVH